MAKLQKTSSRLRDCNHRTKNGYQKRLDLSQHKSKTYVVLELKTIENNFRLKMVFEILESRINKFPPTQSEIEALELFLICNNSIFNNNNCLQTDATA